jgi:hypothetical protein
MLASKVSVFILFHVLNQSMGPLSAIAEPRLHGPQTTTFECAYNGTVAYLASLGHDIAYVAPGLSIAQGGMEKGGVFFRQRRILDDLTVLEIEFCRIEKSLFSWKSPKCEIRSAFMLGS